MAVSPAIGRRRERACARSLQPALPSTTVTLAGISTMRAGVPDPPIGLSGVEGLSSYKQPVARERRSPDAIGVCRLAQKQPIKTSRNTPRFFFASLSLRFCSSRRPTSRTRRLLTSASDSLRMSTLLRLCKMGIKTRNSIFSSCGQEKREKRRGAEAPSGKERRRGRRGGGSLYPGLRGAPTRRDWAEFAARVARVVARLAGAGRRRRFSGRVGGGGVLVWMKT